MHTISVNVAQPRDITFRGEQYSTGIFKRPVNHPVRLAKSGVQHDAVIDRVNHGGEHKAVYAFSQKHYAHWQNALGCTELEPGAFGENLTLSELDEVSIHIGDQLSIGGAVLEVSQPRVPCFKLGIALGNERAPALFTRHFHTGVYFRVLQEGEVSTGDTAMITHQHPAAISVHSLFRAKFDPQWEQSADIMRAAAALGELAPEWQQKVHSYLSAS